ncbi:hypothetical protein SAMN05421774_11421 [Gemmobacter megaterium]|uniref:YHYH domain-containing protein n=1 Tax=Gemmobacter megaterium TaxID=1086013 RepID=A0A1N7QKR0_9RHOB|nr:hypothetical protein SAMN05421774_11421 [Gemmobacter megaterium]
MSVRILLALVFAASTLPGSVEAHGGGCRKSSPPGQCCHMDKKAGRVHCH